MVHEGFTVQHRAVGRAATWAVFVLGVAYAVITGLGFLSLQSPQDPIGEPYVTLMELLIVLMAPLYIVSMVAVHAYAPPEKKLYSLLALIFMILLAGLTSTIHFVVLAVGPQLAATNLPWTPLFFTWTWPSVACGVDILAWDWFFALALLCTAPIFKSGRLEKTVRLLLIISGVLSLAGLLGVLLADMQVRNIGIIGYAVVAPVAFLLMGVLFGRTGEVLLPSERRSFLHPAEV
ncbi:MAG TPA: hypothetical protein P5121_25670 [Caldilineaceae bacterium]|nr:hypothetical protein [Caldilineaceae bacterium]